MKYNKTIALLAVFCIFTLPSCTKETKKTINLKKLQSSTKTAKKNPYSSPAVTIWVHGSRSGSKILATISTTTHNLLYTPTGMTPVLDIDKKYHKRTISRILQEKDLQNFPERHFYTYGWSGDVRPESRMDAAQDLYNELKKLVSVYNLEYGNNPSITIITHSHGGNVALNLAQVREKDPQFTIARLILLASPVQEETKNLITDPFFEQVYSFFSPLDTSQVIDPQGFTLLHKENRGKKCPFFSERMFCPHKKLSQAKIKRFGMGVTHGEFLAPYFLKQLPNILQIMDADKESNDALYDLATPNYDYIVYDLLSKSIHKKYKMQS